LTEEGEVSEPEPMVFFYAIDSTTRECGEEPYGPVELASKPEPITCSYNVYTKDSQLWKVEGMKLLNKVDGFVSDDIWVLIPEGRMAYIENQTQNQVLTVEGGKVLMTMNRVGMLWDKGIPDEDGWYTLTWGPSHEILTYNNDTEGIKINKDDGDLTLTNPEIWKNTCPIEKIEEFKSWTGREVPKSALNEVDDEEEED